MLTKTPEGSARVSRQLANASPSNPVLRNLIRERAQPIGVRRVEAASTSSRNQDTDACPWSIASKERGNSRRTTQYFKPKANAPWQDGCTNDVMRDSAWRPPVRHLEHGCARQTPDPNKSGGAGGSGPEFDAPDQQPPEEEAIHPMFHVEHPHGRASMPPRLLPQPAMPL